MDSGNPREPLNPQDTDNYAPNGNAAGASSSSRGAAGGLGLDEPHQVPIVQNGSGGNPPTTTPPAQAAANARNPGVAVADGRLKLDNDRLPVEFCGGPRSQPSNACYTTTVYDGSGKVQSLPSDMFTALHTAGGPLEEKKYFPYKELFLRLGDDGGKRWRETAPDVADEGKFVYVRFFTKGSHVDSLLKALVPAMLHSVDLVNSITFWSQAKCLRWSFAAAFASLYLLTWFLAWGLAEDEMQEDFSMKTEEKRDAQGNIVAEEIYAKNELCVEPEPVQGGSKAWQQKTDWHYMQKRIALALSFVLLTPRSLVELPLHLHCRGDHPGKGAGKELGARVLFATWMSKEHWKTVDQRGFEFIVPMLALSKFILCIIQVVIWYKTEDHALLVQIAFKIYNCVYLIYRLGRLGYDRYELFRRARRGYHNYLRDEEGAQVGGERLDFDRFEAFTIPTSTNDIFKQRNESEQAFERRINNLLEGRPIDSETRDGVRLNNWHKRYPGFLTKLYLHIFKKHFPHCLGQTFKFSFWNVHWPIPNFDETKHNQGKWVLGAAVGIAILGIIFDAAFGRKVASEALRSMAHSPAIVIT